MGGVIRFTKGGVVKRAVWAAVAVIVVAGAVGLWQPWDAATAQESRVIRVRVAQADRPLIFEDAPGTPCSFTHNTDDGIPVVSQLVVRDAQNAVIAVQNVIGTMDAQSGDDVGVCVSDVTMTVPQAAFYRVEWGDAVITTLTDSDTLEDDVVLIEFSSPTS